MCGVDLAGHVGKLRRVIGPLYRMVSGKAEGLTLWVVDSIEVWVVGMQLWIYVEAARHIGLTNAYGMQRLHQRNGKR
jgi:hypothetical protein